MTTYAPPAPGKWVGSYYRRQPAKPESFAHVHAELLAAWRRDLIKRRQLQQLDDDLIKAIEAHFAGIIGVDDRELAG